MISTSATMVLAAWRALRSCGCLAPAAAAAAALLFACRGAAPGVPSPGLAAPTLSSPEDDSVAPVHPVLTVNNVATTPDAVRTYDFQVAESESGLTGPADALFTTATGVPEGSNGRTSFQVARDLRPGRRYFWRARAVQSGTDGAWSGTFRFRTEPTLNTPPVIHSITATPRAEAREDVPLSAVVQDQETNPATLIYEWTATGGTFAGAGATVHWTAPGVTGPTAFDLTLTLIERYTVAIAGGGEETHENRVTGRVTVHVNDSSREITVLSTTFIDDFLHSDRSPEYCVRNFTDTCAAGKQMELNDIRDVRRLFINDPARSSIGPGSIAFYDAASTLRSVPPSQAAFADFRAPCVFAQTSRSTGAFGIVTGTCKLTHVYENWQWRQCESRFLDTSSSSAAFSRFPFK
jgi:hypothetical protein